MSNSDFEIILASGSGTRKQQMNEAGLQFEVIVSDVDETPNEALLYRDQLADISNRKVKKVFEDTIDRGRRVIIGADCNMVFEGKMYGKPKSLEDAESLLKRMRGRDDIYVYVGNSVIVADKDKVLQSLNITDISRMSFDDILDEEIESYVAKGNCLKYAGSCNPIDAKFLNIEEGRKSTAEGFTIEYALEVIKNLNMNS